jgi:hypothetical protein
MAEEEDEKTQKVQVDSPTLEQQAVNAAQQQANVAPAINIADTGLASQNVNTANAPMVDNTINPTVNFADPAALPQQAVNAAIAGQMQQPSWDETRDRNIANTGTPIPKEPVKFGITGLQPEMYTPEQADAARKYNNGLSSQAQGNGNFVPDYLTGNKTSHSLTAEPAKSGYKSYDPNQFNYLNTSNPTAIPITRSSMANANSASLFDRANAETSHLASPYDNKTTADYLKEPQTQRPSLNPVTPETQMAQAKPFLDSLAGRNTQKSQSQTAPVYMGTRPELPQFPASQQIQNGQTSTNTFQQSPSFKDAYGNNLPERKVYDDSGRRLGGIGGGLALAEYEYKANMNLMRDLARKAAMPDPIRNYTKEIIGYTEPNTVKGRGGKAAMIGGGSPIYQMVAPTGGSPSKNAAEALAAMGGFGAAGSVSGYHQGMANANKTNTDASLAPGLANSTINSQSANAERDRASILGMSAENEQKEAQTRSTLADIANKKMLAEAADFSARNPVLKKDDTLKAKAIDAAKGNDLATGAPTFSRQVFDEAYGAATEAWKGPKPRNRAEAINAYKVKFGTGYTDEQYNKMADRDGYKK